MRSGRTWTIVACALLGLTSTVSAQRTPAGGASAPVRIEKLAPAALEVNSQPVDLVVAGRGFATNAVVRLRRAGDRGNGVDVAAAVASATSLTVRVPSELLDMVGTLELRVRNPDGALSDWATLEVRAHSAPGGPSGSSEIGSRKPVVDRVTPERLEANSRSLHVTLFGRDIADGAVVAFRAGSTSAESRGSLVNGALVVPVPDEVLAKPQAVLFTVKNPGGGVSDSVKIDVVPPSGSPAAGTPEDLAIAQVDPTRVDMRNVRSQRVELIARGADKDAAKVLLRPEGSNDAGKLVPVIERSIATNGTVLVVELTPNMVREGGAYELRIVNPNGKQSNWARVEFLNGDPGVGMSGAKVDARFPGSVTLTAVTATMPVELTVRNDGHSTVRVSDFALVTPDGAKTLVTGALEVPAGATQPLRLDATAPIGAPKASVKTQVALTYRVTLVSSRNPSFDGRSPDDGFVTVSVRNEIDLDEIGRDYVQSTSGGPEGWRFFKAANDANAGSGKAADFALFSEPFARDALPTEALVNYRPDDGTPNERGLFYLVLLEHEAAARDDRARERGTRLGYVATKPAPGLVPLYRWSLSDVRRTLNSFVTTESDASKLPRQLQRTGWRNEGVIGYVVPLSVVP